MPALDAQWAEEPALLCDPVFEPAGVGFRRQIQHADEQGEIVIALLWEADPARFAKKYPDSGVIESYGDRGPAVGCIDSWAYLDRDKGQWRVNVEGWNLPELILDVSGHSGLDGVALGAVFARILGVRPTRL